MCGHTHTCAIHNMYWKIKEEGRRKEERKEERKKRENKERKERVKEEKDKENKKLWKTFCHIKKM